MRKRARPLTCSQCRADLNRLVQERLSVSCLDDLRLTSSLLQHDLGTIG
jgi:hypothetical protein